MGRTSTASEKDVLAIHDPLEDVLLLLAEGNFASYAQVQGPSSGAGLRWWLDGIRGGHLALSSFERGVIRLPGQIPLLHLQLGHLSNGHEDIVFSKRG